MKLSSPHATLGHMVDFSQLIGGLKQSGDAQQNWAASKLASEPLTAVLIAEALETKGICDLPARTMGGSHSVVVELPERHQVLRVVDVTMEHPPSASPLILQPAMDLGEINGFRVQLFPKVTRLSEALAEGTIRKKEALSQIMSMVEQFAEQGLFFWDVTIPNLCVVDGQVKLLDPGSVCPIAERYQGQQGNDMHSNEDKFNANIAYLCKELGEWTQAIEKRTSTVSKLL